MLLCSKSQDFDISKLKENYLGQFKSNFLDFCKHYKIYPKVDKLHVFGRLGSNLGYFPTFDTQFYVYFCEEADKSENLNLNLDEFTEYKWLSV